MGVRFKWVGEFSCRLGKVVLCNDLSCRTGHLASKVVTCGSVVLLSN